MEFQTESTDILAVQDPIAFLNNAINQGYEQLCELDNKILNLKGTRYINVRKQNQRLDIFNSNDSLQSKMNALKEYHEYTIQNFMIDFEVKKYEQDKAFILNQIEAYKQGQILEITQTDFDIEKLENILAKINEELGKLPHYENAEDLLSLCTRMLNGEFDYTDTNQINMFNSYDKNMRMAIFHYVSLQSHKNRYETALQEKRDVNTHARRENIIKKRTISDSHQIDLPVIQRVAETAEKTYQDKVINKKKEMNKIVLDKHVKATKENMDHLLSSGLNDGNKALQYYNDLVFHGRCTIARLLTDKYLDRVQNDTQELNEFEFQYNELNQLITEEKEKLKVIPAQELFDLSISLYELVKIKHQIYDAKLKTDPNTLSYLLCNFLNMIKAISGNLANVQMHTILYEHKANFEYACEIRQLEVNLTSVRAEFVTIFPELREKLGVINSDNERSIEDKIVQLENLKKTYQQICSDIADKAVQGINVEIFNEETEAGSLFGMARRLEQNNKLDEIRMYPNAIELLRLSKEILELDRKYTQPIIHEIDLTIAQARQKLVTQDESHSSENSDSHSATVTTVTTVPIVTTVTTISTVSTDRGNRHTLTRDESNEHSESVTNESHTREDNQRAEPSGFSILSSLIACFEAIVRALQNLGSYLSRQASSCFGFFTNNNPETKQENDDDSFLAQHH